MMSRRRQSDGDPFRLDEFEEQFEEMRNYMARLLEQMTASAPLTDESGPYVYGLSMRVGPDGKPVLQRFGDTRALPIEEGERMHPSKDCEQNGEDKLGEREPLTDVIEDAKNVCITVEIPGVEKRDVELSVADRTLKIKVDSASRRYYKEVHLPAHVDPGSAKATYNNGVLDIALRKASHGTEKKIKIE